MVGVIPAGNKTFEVMGDFNEPERIEGKLYYHPNTKRLYYYSSSLTRPNPANGFFPIWDGTRTYTNAYSNKKYVSDMIQSDLPHLSNCIDEEKATEVVHNQRRATNDTVLKPIIRDGDNFATQTIKGVINAMDLTIVDLIDMSNPKLEDKAIENYYASLTKITFMRIDKWNIWLSVILHVSYVMDVYNDDKKLLTYYYPADNLDTYGCDCDIVENKDALKRIVFTLMNMCGITKATLKTDEVNDYDTNNLMTTLGSNKPLSAQLFSRFIRMAKLSFVIRLYDKDNKLLFEFAQGR